MLHEQKVKKRVSRSGSYPKPIFPPGTSAMSGTFMVLTTWERGVATCIRWVETREAAKFSVMSRLAPAAKSCPS